MRYYPGCGATKEYTKGKHKITFVFSSDPEAAVKARDNYLTVVLESGARKRGA
jgi:hypothetical protein